MIHMPSHLNPLYNARSRREFQDASEQYGTSRFSPEMAELYELQRQMIAARYAPQGGATSQPVESRDDIIRRKMLAYNPPPDPNQAPPESIDQWTRIRNYLGEQLTTGQDSPYPIEDARPATPADYAAQGPAYQQQFRDALASEDAPAPPPPAPFSMGAIPELTAQGAQDWENRRAAIERAGQPIDTSPEAQASRRRNRALSEIGAQSPEKAAEVAALLENTRPATIANTIPQSDLPSGADMIALQGLTPIVDAATFLPRIAMKALPGDEPQFSKDYLNMADMRAFIEQVPSRSSVEGAGRLAAGLGGEVGAFFVPGAMPVQKGVASLTSRMAARALPTSSKVLAGARNLGAGVVGFELPHYAETVLGGESHGEEAMNPLGAPFRLVRDVLGDVSGSLEHPGVINVIRNAGYYADMTPESLDLLRRNLAPATILALPMALHKMGDAGKAKSAEIKDAMKSGDPARVQKAISDMDAPMRDQVATTADDLIMLQRTITPPPMPLAPGTQMPQGGRVVRLGEVVGDREAGQMERAGFIAPSDAAQNVPSAEVPPASLTDALNRARQYGPPRPPKPPSEGATDEATARTSQPESAQGGEATPRLEGAGSPQNARPQQITQLEALAAGTPINAVNGMTLAARFNEWLESSGRPIVRGQAEFLEWLDRPRADNRPPAEDSNAPSMTEQFLAWAQKNPSTIQPPAPTQSPQAPAPTLKDRMAAMRMNPVPEKPGGFSLTAALRARMVGAEVKPPMPTPETPITEKPTQVSVRPMDEGKPIWDTTLGERAQDTGFRQLNASIDAIQKKIDAEIERQEKNGVDWRDANNSPEVDALYNERYKYERTLVSKARNKIIDAATKTGVNKATAAEIAERVYGAVEPTADMPGGYFLADRSRELFSNDKLAAQKIAEAISQGDANVKMAMLPSQAQETAVRELLMEKAAKMHQAVKEAFVESPEPKQLLGSETPNLAASAESAPLAKEPWEMTRGRFLGSQVGERGSPLANSSTIKNAILESHEQQVEEAIVEGKPVPPEVLKDYPDLAKKYGKEAAEAATAEVPTGPSTVRDSFWGMADFEKRRADLNADERILFKNRASMTPAERERADFLMKTAPLNVIGYNATTDAISDASGEIYATVRAGKRRASGQPFYEVKGYSKQAGQHGELEGIYEARGKEEAIEAARVIARRIRGDAQSTPARRPGDVTTPEPATEKSRENVTTEAVQRQASSQAEGPKEGLLTPTPSAQGDTNRPPAQVESTGGSKRFGRFSDDVDAIHEAMAAGEKFQLNTHLRSTLLAKPEHIRATASGVQVPEGKGWVTLTDRQVENLKAQAAGAYLRRPLKGLTGNEAKEGVVINRLDVETDRPVTETFRLLQYGDMDAALKSQAEKFVSSSAHANMRSGGISLFVVETPGKEPRIIRAVSKNNDPAGQFRDEMVSRLSGSALMNDAKPGNKNAEKLVQQKAEYESRREARAKQVREEMAREQAEYDTAAKNAADAATKTKFKKQPITVAIEKGKPSTFEANVSGEFAYHRPLGKDGKPERGGGYVVTHVPTGRVVGRDISTTGKAKETIAALQRFFPPGLTDPVRVTDAMRESLGKAEVPLSDFAQAAGRGDAAKLWVIGDRIAESLAGAKEPQRPTGTPSVAPSNTPSVGKGIITDAGEAARVEAAKEVIKKAVKDSQSRLGTLGGTLEPYFNKEFARAVGDLATIYTKAVMRQGYAQLLEYTEAAFGRFKEFLATHLPEHADVLGQVQGGKFLRRVWARAVASQRDLKNLGVAEKKAQWRAREAFVTGEQVERGRVSLRKAMSEARKDAKKPMISLELTHGLTPQMVNRIKGEDRADALRAMNEVANPLGEIGGVSEAIAALEKANGKVRNLTPQQIDTLASVAEAFSKVSENARALHKDGKILDVNEFAVEGAGDVMKDKPFDLDRRPLTSRIAQALGLKKKNSGDPFQTDEGLRENAMGILRYIHDGASEPYQMIENFFGRASKVYDYFFNSKEGVRAGDTLSKEAEMRARDPVEKVLVDLGMNRETEEAKFRTEKRKFKAGSQELTLTGSEALDLYNHLRASGGNGKRIEENGFKLFTERNRKGKIELTGQDAQSFVDNVPETIRVMSDAMMESGRILHGYWARMYERIFGVRAGDRGPNYWSIMTDTSMRRSLETTLDKYLPTGDLVDSPFTKARAEMTGEPMLITDGLAKWRSMVTQQSRYAGLAEPLLKMRAIINHPDVRDALVRKYGQKVLDKFNTMLEIQSGFRERMGGPEVAGVNKWIKDKTTSVTGPLLAGSLRAQVMSNVTGALQYMKEVDARDFNTAAYGLAKDIAAGRYGALREALKENGYLHNRLDTPTRRLLTPTEWRGLDPTEHKMIEVLNRMSEWVGKNFAGRGDDLNTVLAYKIAEAKAAREGKNPSRAELLTEAEKLVRLTQNPSSLLDMSVSAVDARKTWWGSMYFFIQNGALKARSSLERSIHKGGTEAVKGIALAGLETLGGRIAQTAQWAATALPFMADNDKRKDPGRVAESNLAQAVAEVVDLIVPGAGIAVRQAHAASRYNKAPNFSPLADVQQAMVQVGGTAWGGVAEAMGLRKESKTPTSQKLYKATLELLRAMAPFYKIPPQFMTPLREAMREKPRKKPIR